MNFPASKFDNAGAADYASLLQSRWRAEVELLAACAGSPRQAWPLLGECGVTFADFVNIDTAAIFLTLQWAAEPTGEPRGVVAVGARARELLQAMDFWDDSDGRPFVTGGLAWSASALLALLCRVPFDVELVRAKAAALQEIDRQQLVLINRLEAA